MASQMITMYGSGYCTICRYQASRSFLIWNVRCNGCLRISGVGELPIGQNKSVIQLDHGCHLAYGYGDLHLAGRTETLDRSNVTLVRLVECSVEVACRCRIAMFVVRGLMVLLSIAILFRICYLTAALPAGICIVARTLYSSRLKLLLRHP